MKKRVSTVILAGRMILSMAACSKKAATETTAKTTTATPETATAAPETTEAAKTTFTVGFDQGFPPVGFVRDDGEYTGSDLELAAEMAKRPSLGFVPQPIAWDSKNTELNSGNIDCIWNGLTITGREDDYTRTIPYMENDQVFVMTSDSGIESWDDLAGKTIEIQADSPAEKASQDYPGLTASFGALQTTPDYNTAFMDLEMGSIDTIAMGVTVTGCQIGQRDADFMILEEPPAAEGYGVGFKLDSEESRDDVQGALGEIQVDGTLKAISEKWFGKDVTTTG